VNFVNPVHLLFVGMIALIVLGPKRLPEVARSLGHGLRELREAIEGQSAQQGPTIQQPPAPAPMPAAAAAPLPPPPPPVSTAAPPPPQPAAPAAPPPGPLTPPESD
jgi:TatA/E family protein of Tat protein translocase